MTLAKQTVTEDSGDRPMTQPRVLIVDDEAAIREMLSFALSRAGMRPSEAASARDALVAISEQRPDIILLDWMMPEISGYDFTRRLRKDPLTAELPIIMLTARTAEEDKIAGLDAGTDDYVVKPFSPRELIARIHAILRRSSAADQDGIISAGELKLNTLSRQVSAGGQAIKLGPTEYRLLQFFMSHPGRSYSRGQLLDQVWGANVYLEERTVDVHIRRLRKALESHGLDKLIQTVRGHGYRFMTE